MTNWSMPLKHFFLLCVECFTSNCFITFWKTTPSPLPAGPLKQAGRKPNENR